MKYLKGFKNRLNETRLMPRVVDYQEAFSILGRERVPFKKSEIDVIEKILLVDKKPRFRDVTDTNWFSPDGERSRIAFDCHINRPHIGLSGKDYVLLRIFKFDDDWFLIEELSYGRRRNTRLLADQFEEVRNYLEGL